MDSDAGSRAVRGASNFAGGDQDYLRDIQYADSTKLTTRANLHVKYGRATWFPWWAEQVPWPEPRDGAALHVLEVGCGAGWLWAEGTDQMPAEHIELARLRSAVDRRFEAGAGVFEVTKDVGVFLCTDPR